MPRSSPKQARRNRWASSDGYRPSATRSPRRSDAAWCSLSWIPPDRDPGGSLRPSPDAVGRTDTDRPAFSIYRPTACGAGPKLLTFVEDNDHGTHPAGEGTRAKSKTVALDTPPGSAPTSQGPSRPRGASTPGTQAPEGIGGAFASLPKGHKRPVSNPRQGLAYPRASIMKLIQRHRGSRECRHRDRHDLLPSPYHPKALLRRKPHFQPCLSTRGGFEQCHVT